MDFKPTITTMDISAKIDELLHKEKEALRRIEELKEIRKNLATQRRKLETVLKNAKDILTEEKGESINTTITANGSH